MHEPMHECKYNPGFMRDTLIPQVGIVTDIRQETPDVKTFRVEAPNGGKLFEQFKSLCLHRQVYSFSLSFLFYYNYMIPHFFAKSTLSQKNFLGLINFCLTSVVTVLL